jgi:hypothetical protein
MRSHPSAKSSKRPIIQTQLILDYQMNRRAEPSAALGKAISAFRRLLLNE